MYDVTEFVSGITIILIMLCIIVGALWFIDWELRREKNA